MEYYLKTDKSYFGKIDADLDDLLELCVNDIEGKLEIKPPVIVYGKRATQHRNVAFFSNDSGGYHFAGQIAQAKPMPSSLGLLVKIINDALKSDFNGILVNEYPDGEHYIGKHSDDERYLSDAGVVCLSYGASRIFRIRDKKTKQIVIDIPTTSKEVWIMGGDFQKEFTHEVPVQKNIKDSRVSFTFRRHNK